MTIQQTFLSQGGGARLQAWRTIEAIGLAQVYARAYRVFLWLSMVQMIGIGAAIILPFISGVIAFSSSFSSAQRECPGAVASLACAIGVGDCATRV